VGGSWGSWFQICFFFSGGNRPLKGVLTPSATASGFGSECAAKSPCGKQKQLKNDITQITNGKRRAMSLSDLHSSLREKSVAALKTEIKLAFGPEKNQLYLKLIIKQKRNY
jgi:hypothetical protein